MESGANSQASPHAPRQAAVSHEAVRDLAPRTGSFLLSRLGGATPALVLLVLLSCGYALSGKTNPHIKTIAVPLFANETLEKGIEETLTAEVIDVLQENRTLTLTQERSADSVLRGTIVEYKRSPYSYDQNEEVQEYKVDLVVTVEYEDRKKRRTLWREERMHTWETYFVVPTPGHEVEEEGDALLRAATKLAEDIKTKTVEGW